MPNKITKFCLFNYLSFPKIVLQSLSSIIFELLIAFTVHLMIAQGSIIIELFGYSNLECSSDNNDGHGFDLKVMNTTANPTQNFYQDAVGNWVKNNPIPDEYSRWGSF